MRTVIVVPCYNEAQRLDGEEFRRFAEAEPSVTFLFVNDGSTDATVERLNSLAATAPGSLMVLDLEQNGGKAEAVRRGIAASAALNPTFVGFWDADLATPLSEIRDFVEIFRTRPEIELVFASRVRLLGRNIDRRATRHYLGRVGATLISTTLGLPVYDTQCGAKLFRASDEIFSLFARPFLSKWIFDVEIIARLIEKRGAAATAGAIYELPLRQWHDVKGSKVKSHDFAKALRDLWRIKRAYRLR